MKRMTKLYDETLGYYVPSFFRMEIDTEESMSGLDITKLSSYEQSVFFHEYVHFMQDIMTTSGLYNIYCVNETFRDVAANKATKRPFEVPIKESDILNVRLNNTINYITFGGDSDYDDILIQDIHIEPYSDEDFIDAGINPIEIILLETDKGILQFGRREIMESMAFIYEQLCTKGYAPSPEYPYCTAEKVFKFKCRSGINSDLVIILSLCDISLMTQNPGRIFVDYLDRISSGSLSILKAEDLYDDFYGKQGKDIDDSIKSTMQDFESKSSYARAALKSYIEQNEIVEQLYQWIDLIFDTALSIRQSNPYFFVNMARSGYFIQNKVFAEFIRKVGSPLIRNNHGEYGYFPSSLNCSDIFQYISALETIYNIFEGDFECVLLDFCKQSKRNSKIKINSYCRRSPWKRCNDADLCPVAMIVKHRKLGSIEPTLRPYDKTNC